MSTDIMSTLPLPSRQPTRRVSEMLADALLFVLGRGRNLAHAAGEAEAAVDQRRAEAPLRRQ